MEMENEPNENQTEEVIVTTDNSPRVFMGFNVDRELKERLVAIAKSGKRSLSSLLELIVEKWDRNHDKE